MFPYNREEPDTIPTGPFDYYNVRVFCPEIQRSWCFNKHDFTHPSLLSKTPIVRYGGGTTADVPDVNLFSHKRLLQPSSKRSQCTITVTIFGRRKAGDQQLVWIPDRPCGRHSDGSHDQPPCTARICPVGRLTTGTNLRIMTHNVDFSARGQAPRWESHLGPPRSESGRR